MFTFCSTWICLMLSGNDEFKCDTDGDNGEPNRDMYTCHNWLDDTQMYTKCDVYWRRQRRPVTLCCLNNDIWTQTWLNSFSKDVIKKLKRNRMFSELGWQFSWDTRCSLGPTVFTFFSCRQKGFQLRSLDSAVKRLECVSPFVTALLWSIFLFEKAPQQLRMSMRKQEQQPVPIVTFPSQLLLFSGGGTAPMLSPPTQKL